MTYAIRVRDDATGYSAPDAGKVIARNFTTHDDAEQLRRDALNGHEWEVIQEGADR